MRRHSEGVWLGGSLGEGEGEGEGEGQGQGQVTRGAELGCGGPAYRL